MSNERPKRKKKPAKPKEPVRLRLKPLKNGNQSIYLDCYDGGTRSYEFLKLYIVPEVDEASKRQNQAAMQSANAIKAQRVIEMAAGKAGLGKGSARSKIALCDWVRHCEQEKRSDGLRNKSYASLGVLIEAWCKGRTPLEAIDKRFVEDLLAFMRREYVSPKMGRKLSPSSANIYYCAFCSCLNKAVREGVMKSNPCAEVDRSAKGKEKPAAREFLTIDEVRRLIATDCASPEVKRAFLFSCFCGLRISDVQALRWENVTSNNGKRYVTITMQKTKAQLNLPLSNEALKWLPDKPEGAKPGDLVFNLKRGSIYYGVPKWAKAAGITKKVTFHVSRHTFATMMLTLGADIYTVSKLLGHSDVKQTQIYAKIIDKKKDDAVDLVNGLFD